MMPCRRTTQSWTIRIVSIFFLIFISYPVINEFFIVTKFDEPKIVQGFSFRQIENALDQYERRREEFQLTGIVLHWQRLTGVQDLVRTMIDYDDVFARVLVWNNNPSKNLTFEDLLIERNDRLDIINSPVNIKDLAKYRACEQAKTRACFYVDDDWDIRKYVRSLYSHFLLDPTVLHTITDQFTYFTNLMWTFFDSNIDLHTGFSWIGCGSIYLRDNAIRHLKYINIFLSEPENKELILQSDQFFSIWFNEIPGQFNGRLLHSDEGAQSSFENFDFETLQYRASVLAIQILEDQLRKYPQSNLFQRSRSKNSLVSLTKSPCSYTGSWIFFTNCLPIDDLEEIPFNITVDFERSTRKNLPHYFNSPYKDQVKFFEQHNSANAVDNNTETCWKIHRSVRRGDFFGIDFQTIQFNLNREFSIFFLHSKALQKHLQISISLDSELWLNLPKQSPEAISYTKQQRHVLFKPRYFTSGYEIFRFIRFTSEDDQQEPFEVCEVYHRD